MTTTSPSGIVENYARLTQNWDADSKKNLIIQLVESLEQKTATNFSACFSAWQDNRDAEDIVQEIYDARKNNTAIEDF